MEKSVPKTSKWKGSINSTDQGTIYRTIWLDENHQIVT